MARLARTVVCGLILLLAAPPVQAGDAFAGYQHDSEDQYFAILGIKENLPWKPFELQTFAQLTGAGQRYKFLEAGLPVEVNVQFITTSLGISKQLGALTVSGQIGPRFRWEQQKRELVDDDRTFEVGAFLQLEGMYWKESHNHHLILSFGSDDKFFFSRLRSKLRVYEPQGRNWGRVHIGLDIGGMGNADTSAFQTGPVLEVSTGPINWSAKGGYQYDSNFGSIGYGGIEIYSPF
jgi:hypothetical protein